jgi:hypothetical protein
MFILQCENVLDCLTMAECHHSDLGNVDECANDMNVEGWLIWLIIACLLVGDRKLSKFISFI